MVLMINFVFLCLGLLNLSELSLIEANDRVSGIMASFDQQFPYLVSIQYNNPNTSMGSHCMGVILSVKWVGSSCFCLIHVTSQDPLQLSSPFKFRLIAGTKLNIPEAGIVKFPSQIFNHPQCNVKDKLFDFAMMAVTHDFTNADFESGRVALVPTNSLNGDVISDNFNKILLLQPACQTVGWVNRGIDQIKNLYIFEVELVSQYTCSQVICKMSPSNCDGVSDSSKAEDLGMVCGRALNETPCEGMGGAPLICGSNVWASASLLSECGEKLAQHEFVVFSRVSIALNLVSLLLGNLTTSSHPAVKTPSPLSLHIHFMLIWSIS